jgi:5,10-methylenetetrahydromethanopterin reductase
VPSGNLAFLTFCQPARRAERKETFSMTKFGVMGGGDSAPAETVALAQQAEELGFDTVWLGEGRLTGSTIPNMAIGLYNTEHIKFGTGILPYRTRNVGLLAGTFKTLDEMAPGRTKMGLGPWWEPLASRVGLKNSKPLKAMREVVTVSQKLLAGHTVTYHGEFVDVTDIRFDSPWNDDGHGYDVPIYIGAVRFGMVELAGEIADGVLLDFLLPPSYTTDAWAALRRGAAKSGRDLSAFDVPQLIACAVNDDDGQAAIDACKKFMAQYIAQQSHITEYCGADPDLIAAIKAVLGWPGTEAQIMAAMKLVPNELVLANCACGTTAQVMDKLSEWVEVGVTEIVVTAFGDKRHTIEVIGRNASAVSA